MKWKLPLVLAMILALAAAGWIMKSMGKPAQRPDGHISEVTSAELLERIRGLKTQVVLVNFWASWCEPCKEEFPQILRLREKWAAKGLQVMFVTIDEPQDIAAAEDFLKQQKVNFETFSRGSQSLAFVSEIFPKWEGAVPTTLLFDPQLKILDAWEGDATLAEFEERVARQLGGT